jgi:hypothetical protein
MRGATRRTSPPAYRQKRRHSLQTDSGSIKRGASTFPPRGLGLGRTFNGRKDGWFPVKIGARRCNVRHPS